MNGVVAWIAGSGVVQGIIIGATAAYLTTIVILDAVAKTQTTTTNGWNSIRTVGRPGNGLLVRSALQKALPVVNLFEEAAYWTAAVDGAGRRLSGAHDYRLHFAPGNLPPNGAFWSLTATDTAGYGVRGASGRSAVNDHSGLLTNPDDSVDILLQAQDPGGPAQNWLPTPTGRFRITLRVYLPGTTVVNGGYAPPPIVETV